VWDLDGFCLKKRRYAAVMSKRRFFFKKHQKILVMGRGVR
jgi:hypothetical protein